MVRQGAAEAKPKDDYSRKLPGRWQGKRIRQDANTDVSAGSFRNRQGVDFRGSEERYHGTVTMEWLRWKLYEGNCDRVVADRISAEKDNERG